MSSTLLLWFNIPIFLKLKTPKQQELSTFRIYFGIFYSKKTFLNKKAFKRLKSENLFTQFLHYSPRTDKEN